MTRRPRILIVDDEPAVVQGIRRRLRAAGYDCLSAGDGREGCALAEAERPDLILLDVRMPDCNGREALVRLRQCETTRAIPVIMMSGDEYDREAALQSGADEFLAKPFRGEDLLNAIQSRLR